MHVFFKYVRYLYRIYFNYLKNIFHFFFDKYKNQATLKSKLNI